MFGDGRSLVAHVHVTGQTTIGPRTVVYPFELLGMPPQSAHFRSGLTRLDIGAGYDIRENVTMNARFLANPKCVIFDKRRDSDRCKKVAMEWHNRLKSEQPIKPELLSCNFYDCEIRSSICICPAAAAGRTRFGDNLSLYARSSHRPALPASAELLGICRRIDHAIRPVGGRLDGARAHPALLALGHARARFRAGQITRWCKVVAAVALWPLAGHERDPDAVVASAELPVISLSKQRLPAFVGSE